MPFGVPVQQAPPADAGVAQQRSVQTFDEGLTVEYGALEGDVQAGTVLFKDGVIARYGTTVLRSKTLLLDRANRRGIAEQGVTVDDPDATLSASRLSFTWREKGDEDAEPGLTLGEAEDAEIRVDIVRLKAKRMVAYPGRIEMEDVQGTATNRDSVPYSLLAEKATILEGEKVVLERVNLEIFGQKIGPLPRYTIGLTKRCPGISLPSIKEDNGKIGLSWKLNVPIDSQTVASASVRSFEGDAPGISARIAHSPLRDDQTEAFIDPVSDLGERFSFGWFNNINVKTPEEEADYYRQPRLSYAVETAFNRSAGTRRGNTGDISIPISLIYETGGSIGDAGYLLNGRLQAITPDEGAPTIGRAMLFGAYSLPSREIAPGVSSHTRADIFQTFSEGGAYGWARAEAGLTYRSGGITLGAAAAIGEDYGTPDFEFDRLFAEKEILLRGDYAVGPYKLSVLSKYDLDRGRIYDREWTASIVADAFEPFILYREFPSDYRFGVRFRIEGFFETLRRRL